VAPVAERLHVVEVQAPRILAPTNRHDVVGVQMPLAGVLGAAQLAEHRIDRHGAELRHPEVRHDLRLPSTGAAAPIIADEARHAQSLVRSVVTAFSRRAAPVVVPSLQRLLVHRAPRIAALCDAAATVFAAPTPWEHRRA
jgi:hypothetical protein